MLNLKSDRALLVAGVAALAVAGAGGLYLVFGRPDAPPAAEAGAHDDDVEGGLGLILCAHAGLAEMGIGPDVPAGARRSHRQSGLAQSGHE